MYFIGRRQLGRRVHQAENIKVKFIGCLFTAAQEASKFGKKSTLNEAKTSRTLFQFIRWFNFASSSFALCAETRTTRDTFNVSRLFFLLRQYAALFLFHLGYYKCLRREIASMSRRACVFGAESYGSWLRGERGALVTQPFDGKILEPFGPSPQTRRRMTLGMLLSSNRFFIAEHSKKSSNQHHWPWQRLLSDDKERNWIDTAGLHECGLEIGTALSFNR